MEKSLNTFQDLGLAIRHSNVEVDSTYLIFGMITEVESTVDNQIKLTINYNMSVFVKAENQRKIEFLKSRAFESGIFVAKIIQISPEIEAECKTIIFGQPQAKHA